MGTCVCVTFSQPVPAGGHLESLPITVILRSTVVPEVQPLSQNTDLSVYTHGSEIAESDNCFPNDSLKRQLPERAPGHRCPIPVCMVSVSTLSFATDVVADEMDRCY